MENIISFKIDHRHLKQGIYLHDVKDYGNTFITTYDFRFTAPNTGKFLTPIAIHTIEHVAATYFTNVFEDKIYWGPMGCLTGFYLVLNNKHTVEDVLKTLPGLDAYFEELLKSNSVPGKNPVRCGNYKLLDIKEGYKAWKEFYENKANWGKEYPVLNEDVDDTPYKNDISNEVKL